MILHCLATPVPLHPCQSEQGRNFCKWVCILWCCVSNETCWLFFFCMEWVVVGWLVGWCLMERQRVDDEKIID